MGFLAKLPQPSAAVYFFASSFGSWEDVPADFLERKRKKYNSSLS
jgi:hypothetical protein